MADDRRQFSEFCRAYLEAWDARSTVRSMMRYRPGKADSGVALMPDVFVPALRTPELETLSDEARDFVLTQKAYSFLEEIARHETDTVTNISMEIANGSNRVEIPNFARQALLTVAVDEPYHAFAAREFVNELARIKGIEPISACFMDYDHNHIAFRNAERQLPDEVKPDFAVITVCLMENLITDEVLDFTRTTAKDSPLHHLNKEHMIDEGRHSEFFRRLLRHYWNGLDSDLREILAPAVAALIDGVNDLEDWFAFDREALVAAGVDAGTAIEVSTRLLASREKQHSPTWSNTLRALERAGMLEDERVFTALAERGWIEQADRTRS